MRKRGTNSKHPLYNTWRKIKQKSKLGGNKSIPEHWKIFDSFIKDLPKQPRQCTYPPRILILKRIDKYLPYSKSNIEWIKLKKYVTLYNKREINKIKRSIDIVVKTPRLD